MKSPLLSLPGAVPAEGVDEGVAAHYGDLFREQRALADGTGFVDLSHRGVVTVTGDDRLSWLHLLLTQHVSDLPPGQATEALILSAHGHIEHALYLVDDGATVWAHVEPGTQGALIAYLESHEVLLPGRGRRPHRGLRGRPPARRLDRRGPARASSYARRRTAAICSSRAPSLEAFAEKAGPAVGVLAHEALRVEAAPPAPRLGDRPPHHPARAGLDRHRGTPPEGLLPRPGDRRPRPEPRQTAAPAGLPAPGRQRGPSAAGTARRSGSRTTATTAARSASSRRPHGTTSSARSRWPW